MENPTVQQIRTVSHVKNFAFLSFLKTNPALPLRPQGVSTIHYRVQGLREILFLDAFKAENPDVNFFA